MSKEQRIEATKGTITQLEGQREVKSLAVHNSTLSSLHDIDMSLKSMEQQVSDISCPLISVISHEASAR